MTGPVGELGILPRVDSAALRDDLCSRVDGEVRFDAGTRGAYATDASNYRQVPIGIVLPRTVEAGAVAVEVCREHGAPVLSRGGGTSLGGQCTNVAVVIDWTKYCHHLLSVDAENRTCLVEPGIVLDELNRQLSGYGLEFGPRPSTHSHCAIGGMIGNNSCGATAQRTGKVVDNVGAMEVVTYDGLRSWVGPTDEPELSRLAAEDGRRGELYRGLCQLRDRYAGLIRQRYPDIPRRVSGYNLDALLSEQDFDVAKLLVGSEGTLATVLRAELKLVPRIEHKATLVLGYADIADAADHVADILAVASPLQLEAIDDRLVELMHRQRMHEESARQLPRGGGWLLAQYGGDSPEEARDRAREVLAALHKRPENDDVLLAEDPRLQEKIHAARESGLGVTAHPPGLPDNWPGWEDSAVPPDRLGDYLRDLRALFTEFELDHPSIYGHFGHGCVHTRIPFQLTTALGVRGFRRFVQRAADLVSEYGGSLSGEHGDGQARGELLVRMFGPELVGAFGELKNLFDPGNRMNPGKIVAPCRVDEHLRLGPDWRPRQEPTHFRYPDDGRSFVRAVGRCVGVGKCRQHSGGVMCPSYMATLEEEHSTRGRARLLFEMMRGHEDSPITDGWRSTAVRDALDLCLACKGCKKDCPVGVDMATYKAEFLAHHYHRRPRPAQHYSLGWMPLWAHLAGQVPRLANAALHTPLVSRVGKRVAGIAPQREIPRFAPRTFQRWWRQYRCPESAVPGDPRTVVLWPDTFTNHYHPHIARAAVRVLQAAGFRVVVPEQALCCGLTWISTGQLDMAAKMIRRTLRALRPWIRTDTLVVGLEPSCTAVFRADMEELMPDDEDVRRLRRRFVTLAEILTSHLPGPWSPPQVHREALIQTHCHQHAVLGFGPDVELMRQIGLDAEVLDSGCCGLAGNFGFEKDHYDVSMACAERALLPAVREAAPDTVLLADGFSCRTQIEHGSTRHARHLAEVLAGALG
ncbi:dimethylmenaquinone methyltransferase [Longimycelium tulufanense]|uniref:Dimethylmenaquinone methyltransferase n=1 Tax=Longimycelium tulufanense TaxID=907463 RepID=A0A8J3CCL3_9PSEU|nr:FAD-binding and (Fe-S)-binding domain-containing protein [Longimycelium tulufanense]GGM46421.1 dimethylmenaquinone methyltransferase [Longimycelium tulufanense]